MYWNLISQIKNGYMAQKEKVVVPFSKLDFEVCKILLKNNYIKSAEEKEINKKKFLEIKLLYHNKKPAMNDFKLISTPSRYIYKSYKDLRPVKNGYGIGIISTSKGLMTVEEAIKNKVGGTYFLQVW
jgi:small subunit ribosomal protein S8